MNMKFKRAWPFVAFVASCVYLLSQSMPLCQLDMQKQETLLYMMMGYSLEQNKKAVAAVFADSLVSSRNSTAHKHHSCRSTEGFCCKQHEQCRCGVHELCDNKGDLAEVQPVDKLGEHTRIAEALPKPAAVTTPWP